MSISDWSDDAEVEGSFAKLDGKSSCQSLALVIRFQVGIHHQKEIVRLRSTSPLSEKLTRSIRLTDGDIIIFFLKNKLCFEDSLLYEQIKRHNNKKK